MIKCFNDIDFLNANQKTLFALQCMQCNNIFKKTKKRIVERYDPLNNLSGGFCSVNCASKYKKIKAFTHKSCFHCKKKICVYKKDLKEKNFCSLSCSALYFNSFRKKIKIIKQKKIKKINFCLNCNKETYNKKYCCGTCRNIVTNKFKFGSKSYAEKVLVKKLKNNFFNWTIIENNRTVLGGLELDIYIPEINFAIEWNGIYHLEPIKGNEMFQKILQKDNKKIELCKELGISLLVISDRTSHKKFIEETTDDIINKLKQYEMKIGQLGG